MGFLDELMGDSGRQQQLNDFVQRVEQGAPHEGFSESEALEHHEQVAAQLSPDEYRQAAEEAVGRLSPQERLSLGQQLVSQVRGQASTRRRTSSS